MYELDKIRNLAIIAHVDHGKTTLVDHILKQTGAFRDNQNIQKRVMDSNDIERERGITILAKNLSVFYKGHKINVIDTPGHADFGGEVERTLRMVDGVLLLVDASEGPLPQTKFVLKKSLELGLRPVVVINKIDRKDARPDEVLNEIFDLFVALGASDEQLNFAYVYAIAKQGIAKLELEDESNSLEPLLDLMLERIPVPEAEREAPFGMLISAIDYNDYLGRIGIGKIHYGSVKVGDPIVLLTRDGRKQNAKVTRLYEFENIKRKEVESAASGDIVAIAGLEDLDIGDTLCSPDKVEAIDSPAVEEPRITMNFMVNNSPFAGQEGKYVTTRNISERLSRELKSNVGLRVEMTDSPDIFKVSGRGELHLSILIENMRREGYEIQVSRPEVILRKILGVVSEPMEQVIIDVPEEFVGTVIEKLGKRKAELRNMIPFNENTRLEFFIPSRGLIGYRGEFMTDTRGEGILHHNFHSYEPYKGEIQHRTRGALVCMESGVATAYAINKLQERSVFFIEPGTKVYEGMVVGENSRDLDMPVNVTRAKQLTNFRAAGADDAIRLEPARVMSLEQALEWITDDEFVEITPSSLRIRKRYLTDMDRKNAKLAQRQLEKENTQEIN
ncbi:MAG: translational GTPase TypA [Ignavibacteriales bacterium]|nr:MAG: translational GTPase TypA [Ignavibacteriaceae bacterium]MBW7871841.1 translational GTPase TypA [Ignavibacteria bacterium]MCZ2144309.1 translational GTPase TypA [Ignavibacteriales bacterium]OQY75990.1 MAG: GTP-binding protein TypA [Ignavibacteriales bacterium UTCHB3]MBV6446262.1 GTP-binding protein TypA/BipA [Ignavibacteriaceae bacterium]